MKITVELKPERGYEKTISDFTYMTFLEIIKTQAAALGLRYRIKKGLSVLSQSDNWKKK